jgi:hypothetical protein
MVGDERRHSGGGSSSGDGNGPSNDLVCVSDVTEVGVRGLFLSWISETDVKFLAFERLDGVECLHFRLLSEEGFCYDLWSTGT